MPTVVCGFEYIWTAFQDPAPFAQEASADLPAAWIPWLSPDDNGGTMATPRSIKLDHVIPQLVLVDRLISRKKENFVSQFRPWQHVNPRAVECRGLRRGRTQALGNSWPKGETASHTSQSIPRLRAAALRDNSLS